MQTITCQGLIDLHGQEGGMWGPRVGVLMLGRIRPYAQSISDQSSCGPWIQLEHAPITSQENQVWSAAQHYSRMRPLDWGRRQAEKSYQDSPVGVKVKRTGHWCGGRPGSQGQQDPDQKGPCVSSWKRASLIRGETLSMLQVGLQYCTYCTVLCGWE